MLKKLDKSWKLACLIYCGMFAIMYICNSMTPFMADDFGYHFIVGTNQRVENVWQIIPSMAAHARMINGRLIPHSVVQMFVLLPKYVFDLVNSGMFCLQVALLTGFFFDEVRSNLKTLTIFSAIWVFELAFGQVNLWQDGAVNYLWSVVLLFLYLRPFAREMCAGGGRCVANAF